jgi:hypothetical protein
MVKQFKDFLKEGRASYINYTSKNKSGKKTDDPEKIVKVEGDIPQAKGVTEYETLSEIAKLVKTQKDLTAKLEAAKEEVRVYMEELFDVSDKLNTRVLKINMIQNGASSELIVSLNKDTERKTVDYKGFLKELKDIYLELSVDIDLLLEKYTTISKIASGIKFELNESLMSTLRSAVRKLISYFSKKFKKYDKFIEKYSI